MAAKRSIFVKKKKIVQFQPQVVVDLDQTLEEAEFDEISDQSEVGEDEQVSGPVITEDKPKRRNKVYMKELKERNIYEKDLKSVALLMVK